MYSLQNDKKEIDQAKTNLAARHPFASWLETSGEQCDKHTGGAYYTLDVASLTKLDYYGAINGLSPVTLKVHVAWIRAASLATRASGGVDCDPK